MMFLKEIDLLIVSSRQYFYKLKAYMSLIYGLIILQIFALLSSLGGVGIMGSGSGDLFISIKNYSANIAIVFTFIWIFVTAIILTTKQYKNMDFSLVTNRVSSNLSTIGFLLTACVFGGITSALFNVLLRVIMYFSLDRSQIILDGFYLAFSDLLLGIAIAILYLLLIAATGYFIGVLTKINIIFAIIIPAAFFGLAKVNSEFFTFVIGFFTSETSLTIFVSKVIITSIVLFGLSALLSNGMEVKE
ncbi:MAG: hypothetical protein ACYCVD_09240 [Desulfitobacteriaceae bacterium]